MKNAIINKGESLTEVLEIGNHKDISVDVRSYKPRKIKTKNVTLFFEENYIKDTINQPLLFVLFPFFTSKRQRNVNMIYDISNAGIKFGASLSTDDFDGFKNQQPSDFEKNVFYFILDKFKEIVQSDSEQDYITFNIEEVIDYLGLKFSMKYYNKMEQTLYNLQATTYKFVIRNKRKAGSIVREVYKAPLNLVKYEKLKEKNLETNKTKVLYKVWLDQRIIEELKRKFYIIFDRHRLNDLRKSDKAAERIYQFISMKRYAKGEKNAKMEGEYDVRTLAAVVPLAMKSVIVKKLKSGEEKEYTVSKLKQVMKRVKRAFSVLKEQGYIESFEVVEDKESKSYIFRFKFNYEKDGDCHISDKFPNRYDKKLLEAKGNRKPVEKEEKVNLKFYRNLPEKIIERADKARNHNIYISRSWNKRVENKILKIYNEDGEGIILHILEILHKNVKTEIKSLVSYMSGILKNVKKDEELVNSLEGKEKSSSKPVQLNLMEQAELKDSVEPREPVESLKATYEKDDIIEAEIVEEKPKKASKKKQGNKTIELDDPMLNVFWNLFERLGESEQTDIREKAKAKYCEKAGISCMSKLEEKLFTKSEKKYILDVLKGA